MDKQKNTDEIKRKELVMQMCRLGARRGKAISDLKLEVYNFAARSLNLLNGLERIDDLEIEVHNFAARSLDLLNELKRIDVAKVKTASDLDGSKCGF